MHIESPSSGVPSQLTLSSCRRVSLSVYGPVRSDFGWAVVRWSAHHAQHCRRSAKKIRRDSTQLRIWKISTTSHGHSGDRPHCGQECPEIVVLSRPCPRPQMSSPRGLIRGDPHGTDIGTTTIDARSIEGNVGNGNDQVAAGAIANEEATKTSRMAKLTKVMTTKGTFSRRNI